MAHRAVVGWMGQQVETLADLIPPKPRAVVVGINPAPVSVAAGHYYQGAFGKRLWERLADVGLLPSGSGWEDDRAVAAGVGFTDIVKRPSRSADDVTAAEFQYGRRLLVEKLEAAQAPLVIFVFKKAATAYFGKFDGNGFVRGLRVGPAEVFVMPGPMEAAATANARLGELAARVAKRRG